MNEAISKPPWWPEGNARITPEMGSAMISALSASGLSVAAFARSHGVPKQRIFYWRERISGKSGRGRLKNAASRQSGFAPVIAKESHCPSVAVSTYSEPIPAQTLEATLPNGRRVVIHGIWSASLMKSWLAAIEGTGC